MGIIYGKPLMSGGQKPSQLNVTTNGTWSKTGGYSPVNVNVSASAVTSGTKVITANGDYDVTEFKNVNANIPASAVTSGTRTIIAEGTYDVTEFKNVRVIMGVEDSVRMSPIDGFLYDGLPNDWNTMKEIAKMISGASGSINANTTGSIYVNKGGLGYKITPGDTINVTSTAGTHAYAVMGFNNFALTNRGNYGGTHTTAGLTFGMVDCVESYKMNSSLTNSGGWGACSMRTSTMSTLQSGMPGTLAQVKVPYVDYNNQSTILYSDDYIFLPAEKEVQGTRRYSPEAEANALTQFAYYKNGGSKIKNLPSGSSAGWWLRSVLYNGDIYFCCVGGRGGASSVVVSATAGAAPCFCV